MGLETTLAVSNPAQDSGPQAFFNSHSHYPDSSAPKAYLDPKGFHWRDKGTKAKKPHLDTDNRLYVEDRKPFRTMLISAVMKQ